MAPNKITFLKMVRRGTYEGEDDRGVFWRISQTGSSRWEIFYGQPGKHPLEEGEYSPGTSLADAKSSIALQIRYETDPAFKARRDQWDREKRDGGTSATRR
jgi:hypothetical protein